jgi:uncharacterized protein YoxC
MQEEAVWGLIAVSSVWLVFFPFFIASNVAARRGPLQKRIDRLASRIDDVSRQVQELSRQIGSLSRRMDRQADRLTRKMDRRAGWIAAAVRPQET